MTNRTDIAELRDLAAANIELIMGRLGIEGWRGNRHIRCPFPGHEDSNPSWRWKREDGRFYCSCGSGTVFDLIMLMTGVDFGQACRSIRAIVDPFGTGLNATAVPRSAMSDQEKEQAEFRRQVEVEAVLDSSSANNVIYKQYMSARFGFEAMVFPTTRVACHYDAPVYADKNTMIARSPMIAFEMVGNDARTQAMRIYVNPLLNGKAFFMYGGSSIKPKKLMHVPQGCRKVHGHFARFGRADAERWVIAEGVETAAAIYQSIQMEKDMRGSVAVAACMSDWGIRTWHVPESARHVVIGADRDEQPNSKGVASLAGSEAAHDFMQRHQGKLQTAMVLPGAEGTKADWLDHMIEHGPSSVAGHMRAALGGG